MGLFSDLLKGVAGNILSQVQEAAGLKTTDSKPAAPKPAPVYVSDDPIERTPAEAEIYFEGLLRTRFPQYVVRKNVPVQELAGDATDMFKLYKTRPTQAYKAEWGKPYTFVLFGDGGIRGIVMLGNGHSHDANVKYPISRMYAKKMGIPYINFYTQMPNEEEYVVSRIQRFLAV